MIIATIFSLCFSAAVFFSIKMPTHFQTIYWRGITLWDALLFCFIWVVTTAIFCFIQKLLDGISIKPRAGNLPTALIFLLILMAWLPFFLAFYPGNLSADSYSSINQAITYIKSTAHPVLFTLLVKLCLQTGLLLFGNMNAGIAVFSVVQMLMLDGILTYTVKWLQKHQAPRWWLVLSVAYFALNPLIVRFSFTMWKDILFSGVILLLVLFMYDLVTGVVSLQENTTLARFLLLSVLAAFLRNRIIYAMIAIFIILLIIYRTQWKKLLPAFLLTAVITLLIQGPLYHYLNIKPSNFAEGQGVTLQQLAAVVVNDGDMTEEEKAFLNQIIPLEDIPKAYHAGSVDSLKGYETFSHDFLNSHSAEYLRVWRSVVLKNPWISIKAWLMNTRSFWGFGVWIEPFAITWPSERLNIHQINIVQNMTGVDLCYLSNGILVNLGKVPVLRRIFELGSLGWLSAFLCLRLIVKKRYSVLVSVLPLTLLWLVLIATTPVFFEVRYMFAFHLALPVLGCMLLMGEKMDANFNGIRAGNERNDGRLSKL